MTELMNIATGVKLSGFTPEELDILASRVHKELRSRKKYYRLLNFVMDAELFLNGKHPDITSGRINGQDGISVADAISNLDFAKSEIDFLIDEERARE